MSATPYDQSEPLDGSALMPAAGPGAAAAPSASALAAQQLIRLDQFRSDPRYAGIDGRGYSMVIIDTGIDLLHPAFGPDANGNGVADRITYTWDFADNDANVTHGAFSSHGTYVASIAGSQMSEVPGVAPGVNIIVLKVFPDSGGPASMTAIESALQWVEANRQQHKILSVNLSLGQDNHSSPQTGYILTDEFSRLETAGVIVAAAAGNHFHTVGSIPGVAYPAADPNVIAVGAVYSGNFGQQSFEGATDNTTGPDRIAGFSQREGSLSGIFAPGAMITVATPGGGFTEKRGTSMASPFVAGAAVLAQQLAFQETGRFLTVKEFRILLSSSGVIINDGDDENDNVANTGLNFRRLDMLALAGAITGDAVLPTISIGDVQVAEGQSGATVATVTVRLSGNPNSNVTVRYATAGGTATQGSDYEQRTGTIVFTPFGSLTQTIQVPVFGDGTIEPSETFFVRLSQATGATLARDEALVTILDDDTAASDWQNPANRFDVDSSGSVTAFDALAIINRLNAGRSGPLTTPWQPGDRYFDVNGDRSLTAFDALAVINRLNAMANQNSQPQAATLGASAAGEAGPSMLPIASTIGLDRSASSLRVGAAAWTVRSNQQSSTAPSATSPQATVQRQEDVQQETRSIAQNRLVSTNRFNAIRGRLTSIFAGSQFGSEVPAELNGGASWSSLTGRLLRRLGR